MNQKNKNKKIIVFFTQGMSLKRWHVLGNLSREIAIYKVLVEEGSQVGFVTYGKENDIDYLGEDKNLFSVYPKKISWLPDFLYCLLIGFLYKKDIKKYDIIKTNQMYGAWGAVIASKICKIPLLVRCGYEWFFTMQKRGHGKFKLAIVKMLEKFVYKNSNHIVVTAVTIKKFILKNFKSIKSSISIIPNYIDTRLFAAKDDYKKHGDKIKIITVGRLSKEKNYNLLIQAVDGLDVELDIYGKGEEKKDLERLIDAINIAEVHLVGMIANEDLPDKLRAADIFILPSKFEGNPKALLEAMSCGLPCIGSDVGGIMEIVADNKNGLIVERHSSSIRKGIKKLVENERIREKLGKNARKTIKEHFSFEAVLAKEKEVYTEIV